MASWAGLLALSGFGFDAHQSEIRFAPKVRDGLSFRSFFSNATSWGQIEMANGSFAVTVLHGETRLARVGLPLEGGSPQVAINGSAVASELKDGVVTFKPVRLAQGDVLRVSCPNISVETLRDVSTL
jgi:non-lysosomal glucosylceramidase